MSVELQKLRAELLREALLKGWTKAADVEAPWPQQIEPARIARWYKHLYSAPSEPLPVGNRLVNHFMLGADPEFVFHDGSQRIDARNYHLKAGPAFGADNNGRLCELRPQPSRSALSVLASLWLAMRWLAVFQPQVLRAHWRSGGFFEGDGLGGHVHFGRKRTKFRDREVAVLDRLTHLQFVAGIFDREEGRLRVRRAQGAPAGQPYGALGDMRRQPHGYEYRTLPSWIDNPWLAYFNLVLAKLVVAFPDMVAPLAQQDADLAPERARSQLRMLLAYWQAQDDDARLAAAILARRGFPEHAFGTDFKPNWGLFVEGPLGAKREASAPSVLPETVPARLEDEQELASAMFEGRPPELTELKPTWTPSTLPSGYVHAIQLVDTKVAPGLGEFVMPLCTYREMEISIANLGHSPSALALPRALRAKANQLGDLGVPVEFAADSWNIYVNASKDFTLEQLYRARDRMLASGLLPIWDIAKVQADSYSTWAALVSAGPKEAKGSKVELHFPAF